MNWIAPFGQSAKPFTCPINETPFTGDPPPLYHSTNAHDNISPFDLDPHLSSLTPSSSHSIKCSFAGLKVKHFSLLVCTLRYRYSFNTSMYPALQIGIFTPILHTDYHFRSSEPIKLKRTHRTLAMQTRSCCNVILLSHSINPTRRINSYTPACLQPHSPSNIVATP